MLYIFSIFAVLVPFGSILFLLFQKKYVAEKKQLEVERKLFQVRSEVQHLIKRVEAGRDSLDMLEHRIAERNHEIRLLKEDLVVQERQERLAEAVGW